MLILPIGSTAVQGGHGPLVLTLRSPYETYRAALIHLRHTVESYAHWKDNLSLQLRSWQVSTVALLENGSIQDVARKIVELQILLRNPIDGALFRLPYLAGGDVWEKWMLEGYIGARRRMGENTQSPLDTSQSLEGATAHHFAAAMLLFLHRMPPNIASLLPQDIESDDRLHEQTFQSWDDESKITHIYFRAIITKKDRVLAASQARRQAVEDQMAGRVETAVTHLHRELNRLREDSISNIHAMRDSHVREQTALNGRIDLLKEDLEKEQKENRNNANRADRAEAQLASLAARISDLENRDDGICSMM